ncbi:MAG: ABC transporter substrate-binding protein, partial [Phycisphaeraceae bacterium]|nr:ABC transporter substrate-binding protein [Phycisphaeraceae bacterium]
MRWILSLLVIGAFGLTVFLTEPPEPADLRSGYTAVETLDPQLVSSSEDVRISYALFEGLTTFDNRFQIQPAVARSWEVSEDRQTYTFTLRPEARWSNGDPVTAHDFVFSWRIAMMADTAPRYIHFLWHIRGAKDFFDWTVQSLADIGGLKEELDFCVQELEHKLKLDEEEKKQRVKRWERLRRQLPEKWVRLMTRARTGVPSAIQQARDGLKAQQRAMAKKRFEQSLLEFEKRVAVEAIDDHTLRVSLEKPLTYFLEVAACWPLMPVHRPTIEKHSRVDPNSFRYRRDPQWTKPQTIVGNGPFKLNRWQFKRQIHMVANPHYWNAEARKLNSMRLDYFKSPQTMFIAYERGQIDLYLDATLSFIPELIELHAEGKRNDVHGFNAYGTYYYLLNCREKMPDGRDNPFADVNVRRAFVMSVDRKAIVEQVTRLRQETTSVFVPPGAIPGYEP